MTYHGYYSSDHRYVFRLGNRLLLVENLRFKEVYVEPPWEFVAAEGVVPDFDIRRPPATYYCRHFAWSVAEGWIEVA